MLTCSRVSSRIWQVLWDRAWELPPDKLKDRRVACIPPRCADLPSTALWSHTRVAADRERSVSRLSQGDRDG